MTGVERHIEDVNGESVSKLKAVSAESSKEPNGT